MFTFISFVFSLGVIIFGARLFLNSAISFSRLLRLPEMVIGATLVSLATTMPEILVSLFASATAHSHLALGNILGSGLVNLGFLFGIILLAGHGYREQTGRGKRRSLILFLLVVFVYLWFLIFGKIGLVGGTILIAFALIFLGYTLWSALKESGESFNLVETELETHPKVIFKFALGALLLIFGARFLVNSGIDLARFLHLPEIVIGLTLVAVGTSLPELVVALTALASGHGKISLGNLTGATILTLTLALGLAGIITEIRISQAILKFDFLLLLLFSGLALIFAFWPRFPQKLLGGALVIGYLIYLLFLFVR